MSTFTQNIAAFFRLGRMPTEVKAQMRSEGGMLYLAEEVAETAIITDFRSPGFRCGYRRMTFIGFFAVSEHRVVVSAKGFHKINVNATFDDPKFKQLAFRATQKYLSLTFDPASHLPDTSGQIEIRLHLPDTPKATVIHEERGACITYENNGGKIGKGTGALTM